MDTQDSGTSTEETLTGDSSTEQTEETATSDTSEDGAHEDADTLRDRLSEKDRYIKQLEAERLEGTSKKKPTKREAQSEDPDDVMTWMTLNGDQLKLVGKEYKEELAFYKSHGIPVTDDIRDRALRDARARKGVGSKSTNAETERQVSTSSESSGEMRKTASREVPESIKKLYPDMTPERYAKYKAEIDSKQKKG